jgi:hypothetical protein
MDGLLAKLLLQLALVVAELGIVWLYSRWQDGVAVRAV